MGFESRLLPHDVVRRLNYYPRAREAVAYAWQHLERPIRLDDVAGRAAMTPSAFSRYFANKTGMAFFALVKVLRIEQAIGELESNDGAIADVAEKTGYQSCCTFSRAFKDVVGTTPSEYRRRLLFGSLHAM